MAYADTIEQIMPPVIDKLPKKVDDIITQASGRASAIAALPLPILDLAGVGFIQLRLINNLAEHYRVRRESDNISIISVMIMALISKILTEAIGRLAEAVELDKMLGKTMVSATLAGLLTQFTGEVYAKHFAAGGDFSNITFENYLDYLQQQLKSDRWNPTELSNKFLSTLEEKLGV